MSDTGERPYWIDDPRINRTEHHMQARSCACGQDPWPAHWDFNAAQEAFDYHMSNVQDGLDLVEAAEALLAHPEPGRDG